MRNLRELRLAILRIKNHGSSLGCLSPEAAEAERKVARLMLKRQETVCGDCGGLLDTQGFHFHGHCHANES